MTSSFSPSLLSSSSSSLCASSFFSSRLVIPLLFIYLISMLYLYSQTKFQPLTLSVSDHTKEEITVITHFFPTSPLRPVSSTILPIVSLSHHISLPSHIHSFITHQLSHLSFHFHLPSLLFSKVLSHSL